MNCINEVESKRVLSMQDDLNERIVWQIEVLDPYLSVEAHPKARSRRPEMGHLEKQMKCYGGSGSEYRQRWKLSTQSRTNQLGRNSHLKDFL